VCLLVKDSSTVWASLTSLIFDEFYRTGRMYGRGAVVKFILIDITLPLQCFDKLSQLALSDGFAGENSPKISVRYVGPVLHS